MKSLIILSAPLALVSSAFADVTLVPRSGTATGDYTVQVTLDDAKSLAAALKDAQKIAQSSSSVQTNYLSCTRSGVVENNVAACSAKFFPPEKMSGQYVATVLDILNRSEALILASIGGDTSPRNYDSLQVVSASCTSGNLGSDCTIVFKRAGGGSA